MKLFLCLLPLFALCACGLVTEALRATGVPIGPGADEAAKHVDTAVRGWIDALLFGIPVAVTEGTRLAHKTVKRRRERKKKAAEAVSP